MFYSHPDSFTYEAHVRDWNYRKAVGEGFGAERGLQDINTILTTEAQVGVLLPLYNVIRDQLVLAIGNGMKSMDWSVLDDAARLHAGVPQQCQ